MKRFKPLNKKILAAPLVQITSKNFNSSTVASVDNVGAAFLKTSLFHQLVTSVPVLQAVQANVGVSLNGAGVSFWADQSGKGKHYSQSTVASQPLYNPTGVNGRPTITFDGVDDFLTSSLQLDLPGTKPTFLWLAFRQITWTNNDRIVGDGTNPNIMLLFQSTGSPGINIYNSFSPTVNIGATIGSWVRVEALFGNATTDYLKAGASTQTGTATGNSPPSGIQEIGRATSSSLCSNIEVIAVLYFSGLPTTAELAALSAAAVTYGGSGVLV